MSNQFSFTKAAQLGLTIFYLEGELDAHTAPQFDQAMESEINHGNYRIIVDCEKLTHISSAGLGVFMNFIEEVRSKDGDIKISGLTPEIKEIFDIMGFLDIYDLVENVTQAAQLFAQPLGRRN